MKHLYVVDNLSLCLANTKKRTSSFQLVQVIRSIGALALATGSHCISRWIPSEVNPADEPSRCFKGTLGGQPLRPAVLAVVSASHVAPHSAPPSCQAPPGPTSSHQKASCHEEVCRQDASSHEKFSRQEASSSCPPMRSARRPA